MAGDSPRFTAGARGVIFPRGLWILLTAVGLPLALFFLEGNIGFILADGGFLWYGVKAVLRGEVPLRDFQSYDPGRYYWCALWAPLLGTGPLATRFAVTIFRMLGLAAGLCVLRRFTKSRLYLAGSGLILVLWSGYWWKGFESALTMMGALVALRLLEKPTLRRHAAAGAFVGLAAFMGRNHGLYMFVGFALCLLAGLRFTDRERPGRKVLAFLAGVLLGYSPMLIMASSVDGFSEAFIEQLMTMKSAGRTNLPLPVPWPWRVSLAGKPLSMGLHQLLTGVMYLFYYGCLAALSGLILWRALRRKPLPPVLVVSAALGVGYLHHASVRAGAAHLAQSIHPLLIGLMVLPFLPGRTPRRRLLLGLGVFLFLAVMTPAVTWTHHPLVRKTMAAKGKDAFIPLEIQGDRLWVARRTAIFIEFVENLVQGDRSCRGRAFFAPFYPGLYALLDMKSPTREIYFLWPPSPSREREMIGEVEEAGVQCAFIADVTIEGRKDLYFRNSHPDLWRHFQRTFERAGAGLPPRLFFLKRRNAGGSDLPL